MLNNESFKSLVISYHHHYHEHHHHHHHHHHRQHHINDKIDLSQSVVLTKIICMHEFGQKNYIKHSC